MEIFKISDQVRDIAIHFKNHCTRNELECMNLEDKEIYDRLVSLGEDPKLEDVEEILEDMFSPVIVCNICGSSVSEVVYMSEESEVEICFGCIRKAYKLI